MAEEQPTKTKYHAVNQSVFSFSSCDLFSLSWQADYWSFDFPAWLELRIGPIYFCSLRPRKIPRDLLSWLVMLHQTLVPCLVCSVLHDWSSSNCSFTISTPPRSPGKRYRLELRHATFNKHLLFIMLYPVNYSFLRSLKLSSAAILATFVCDITRVMSEQSL